MANNKTTINDIPLMTNDVCLNKYKTDISAYTGFREKNALVYGGVLSPFYKKETALSGPIYNNTQYWIDKKNNIYQMKADGKLYKNDSPIFSLNDTYFGHLVISRLEWADTLAFIDRNTRITINGSNIVLGNVVLKTYEPTDVVSTVYKATDGSSLFTIGNTLYYYNASKGGLKKYTVNTKKWAIYERYQSDTNISIYIISTEVGLYILKTTGASTKDWYTCTLKYRGVEGSTSGSSGFVKVWIPMTGQGIAFNGFSAAGYNNDWNWGGPNPTYWPSEAYFSFYVTNADIVGDHGVIEIERNTGSVQKIRPMLPHNGNGGSEYIYQLYDQFSAKEAFLAQVTTLSRGVTTLTHTESRYPAPTFSGNVLNASNITVSRAEQTLTNYIDNVGVTGVLIDSDNQFNIVGTTEGFDGSYSNVRGYRFLYHNGQLQAISVAPTEDSEGVLLCGYSLLDTTAPISVDGNEIIFKTIDGVWNVVRKQERPQPDNCTFSVAEDRYIILPTSYYYNVYDTVEQKWLKAASDYNDRAVLVSRTARDPDDKTNAYRASGVNTNPTITQNPFTSTLFSQTLKMNLRPNYFFLKDFVTFNKNVVDVYFSPEDSGSYPLYLGSLIPDTSYDSWTTYKRNELLVGSYWPWNDINIVPSIFATYTKGFNSVGSLVKDGNVTYQQKVINSTLPIFTVELASQQVGATSSFIIQGRKFAVIDDIIYAYSITEALQPIINISGMKLIGNTPYEALFFSNSNKTIYQFTGDNLLKPVIQCNEIDRVVNNWYNPSTMSTYLLTDKGLVIFSSGSVQIAKLSSDNIQNVFITEKGFTVVESGQPWKAIQYQMEKENGFEALPIILHTKYYGSNERKFTNDCVYIRLYDETMPEGTVKVLCSTLNEGVKTSEEKVFKIDSSKWDKCSKTIFLRYQPKYQECSGFSVEIYATVGIVSLAISNTVTATNNSRNNI